MINTLYKQARDAGYRALESKRIANTVELFEQLGDSVRLRVEQDQENYFDVYGEPDGYVDGNGRRVSAEQERQELVDMLELNGCWCVIAEYRCKSCGEWKHADSIGMCTGYDDPMDPVENCYVPDLMQSAMRKAIV